MSSLRRPRRLVLAGLTCALTVTACGGRAPVAPERPARTHAIVPIMGAARLTPAEIVAWFHTRRPQPRGVYAATVPLESLASYFVEEGSTEGVTGDVAFMQSIVETGWFRFDGVVPASSNNFAGIGATGSSATAALFADARTGVRAQIQHLRAYADPTARACAVPPLSHPCVDPRFHLVTPPGKAPTWNHLGNGNWATATGYASSILSLYEEAVGFTSTR